MSRSRRRCRGRRDSPGTERCDWRRTRARGKPPQIHSPIASSEGAPGHKKKKISYSHGSNRFLKVLNDKVFLDDFALSLPRVFLQITFLTSTE
jgi:hypothetical protein